MKNPNFQHFGAKNHRWVEKNPSYTSIHTWLWRYHKKPNKCNFCPSNKALEWALKKGFKHDRVIDNYLCLCSSCHKKYDYTDDRRKKLSESMKGRKITWAHKISKTNKGRKLSKEQRENMSEFQKKYSKLRKRNNKGQFI